MKARSTVHESRMKGSGRPIPSWRARKVLDAGDFQIEKDVSPRELPSLLMLSLDQLTCEMFAPLTSQVFQSGEVELKLKVAKVLGNRRHEASREPFSLLFQGPPGMRAGQGIYRLAHQSLGELEMFITQVADGPDGSEFEAIFT